MDRRQAMKTLALGAAAVPLLPGGVFALAGAQGGLPSSAITPGTPPAKEPFSLPALRYPFDALEPHFDAQTMQIHHDKHHAAYVNNLNKAVAGRKEVEGWTLEQLVGDLPKVPDDIRTAVRNHGGGHYNHSLFWTSLMKDGVKRPQNELGADIDKTFGSFDAFRQKFDVAAGSVFGSGWAWLVMDPSGALKVSTTANQDSPLTAGDVPLVGIDVWEHAYYLQYQNRRAEYIAAFHAVVHWDAISQRYRDARSARHSR